MSSWTKVLVDDTSKFDETVIAQQAAAAASGVPLYVMITSDFSNEEMCERWCPDCRLADPIIYAALDKSKRGILVECPVPRSGYKGNPDHPYRVHPVLQIQRIPTLINWNTSERLLEAECYDIPKVEAFIQ